MMLQEKIRSLLKTLNNISKNRKFFIDYNLQMKIKFGIFIFKTDNVPAYRLQLNFSRARLTSKTYVTNSKIALSNEGAT